MVSVLPTSRIGVSAALARPARSGAGAVTNGAGAGAGAMMSLLSTQRALNGLRGHPAGDVSEMVAATPMVPVMFGAPASLPTPVTVMVSLNTFRPDNAK
ncbi:hypothetical protein D9M72_423460 [compost metagenome]